MNFESIIGITASLIGIGTLVYQIFDKYRRRDLSSLMTELADKNTPIKRQRKILQLINLNLRVQGGGISTEYINSFSANGRSKSTIFHDICLKNNIEPIPELCSKTLGYDEPKFRNEWTERNRQTATQTTPTIKLDKTIGNEAPTRQTVYMSALLAERFPETYGRLVAILDKHGVAHGLLKGTRDIWCRDYMPVQRADGQLVQFRYEPSYLTGKSEWEQSRSDVKELCRANGLDPIFSDINLDGGNVLVCGKRAIISDRVFSENPDRDKNDLVKELSDLLGAEIIIIPSINEDFTGHADGMVRFVNPSTILGNDRTQEYKYWSDGINRVIQKYGLIYIDFPFFYGYKDKNHKDHAIGIYVNYLEVGDLIVMPVFGVPGNKDFEAIAKLKEIFPDKAIETINYNDIALDGGLLNCTTWVLNQ
ncbi:MAG: agmatine deiminase family protein [Muribaculaceae bacterium]